MRTYICIVYTCVIVVVLSAGQLCQDILQTLLTFRLLRKSHLQLLLVPQITEINFAAAYANTISAQALDILTLRCKVLHLFTLP